MELPFSSHTIYVTLDDDKIYEVKSDYSMVEVAKIEFDSILATPFKQKIVLHKAQFDAAKGFLLNKENPFKLKEEDARLYNKIRFLSDSELEAYLLS